MEKAIHAGKVELNYDEKWGFFPLEYQYNEDQSPLLFAQDTTTT